MHRLTSLVLVALFFSSLSVAQLAFFTYPSNIDWVTRESSHFKVLYRRGQDDLAIRSLKAAERSRELLAPIFPQLPETTWMVVADFNSTLNGYSINLPWPHIALFVTPPSASEQLSTLDDWLFSLVLHEYVHTLHLYPASGFYSVMRAIFGSWVMPNAMLPPHYHEGLAVLLETENTSGGRGESTYYRMLRREAVRVGKWGSKDFGEVSLMDGTAPFWPLGRAPYFFGYYFFKELMDRKGSKGVYHLVEESSSNWPYLIGLPLNEVYQTDHEEIWSQVFEKNKNLANEELSEIKNPDQPDFLTHTQFQKWDLVASPKGTQLLYRSSNPHSTSEIILFDISSQKSQAIVPSSDGVEGLCWAEYNGEDRILMVQPVIKDGQSRNTLFVYNPKTREQKQILINNEPVENIHRISCGGELQNLLVYEEVGGKGFVKSFFYFEARSRPEVKLQGRWKIPEGSWVSSLLQQQPAWFALRVAGSTEIYQWKAGENPTKLVSFRGHLWNLQLGQHNSALEAIAEFDGRYEVWGFDFDSNQVQKLVTLNGGVNSFIRQGSELYMLGYRHGGYDLSKVTIHPLGKGHFNQYVLLNEEAKLNLPDTKISQASDYSAWSTVFPRFWLPSLLFVPDGVQFGALVQGFDIARRHNYRLTGGYDTRGSGFGSSSYQYRFGGHWNISLSGYYLPSYIRSSRTFLQQYGAGLSVGTLLPGDISLSVGPIYRKLESSRLGPAEQSIGGRLSLARSFAVKQQPQEVAPSQGTLIELGHSQFFKALSSDNNYFRSTLSLTQYLSAPWIEAHKFKWQLRGGYTEGSNFYNSFFEGGGELLFYQDREFFPSRGFLSGNFIGRRMATLSMEYLFPLADIYESFDYWPLFLKRIHLALVGDLLTFDNGPNSFVAGHREALFRVFFPSAGLEVNTQWNLFHYLPTTIRLGIYHGFGPFGEDVRFSLGVAASI